MKKIDAFAQIAAAGINNEGKGLITPEPVELEERYLEVVPLEKAVLFTPLEKIRDKEGLYEEVERQKTYYRPFLADYAPALENRRTRSCLQSFQWRIGTEEDFSDFPGVLEGRREWEQVEIPHYGEPRGNAVTFYRTVFYMEDCKEDESAWVSFDGVDYKAHVFVNGAFLGSHEGFFAPFEFEFTRQVRKGENTLLVMVENDYIHMGSCSERGGEEYTGDKFYAATGPGYDEPYEGWHICPPGMGICQEVFIETRKRMFLSDVFVRPMEDGQAEIWLEVFGCDVGHRKVSVDISVYGQNFRETLLEHEMYQPCTSLEVGVGDSLTEANRKADGSLGSTVPLAMERGINYLKIPLSMGQVRQWELTTPWLYQVQVRLIDEAGNCLDAVKSQFGFRSFQLDEACEPKGRFRLNGKEIRLRGANSMGFEQQCVMKKDWDQLFTDLILAKVCNMNFLRMTQRPVQRAVYEYCDRLGLMLQTDLPAFGAIRRNQFTEGIRQVQEMEHLIRSHPSAVLVSYINEPMPNAKNRPHRCLTRPELEDFFTCADLAVKILNPDRVVKHVDGDYDPPTEGLPDNHCYPCWYNGHGIDIGRLHKGFWMNVRMGWNYACGEYGIEGLEETAVMRKYYPRDWLPANDEEEYLWTPGQLPCSQSGNFHYFFYDTQHSLEDWVRESQRYQAEAVRIMTEAYRRDNRMVSFAYHLFIDAFPEGWTKTLMDVDRNPKKAFFAYRDALEPVMVSLRTDRFRLFSGETAKIECWLCNDTDDFLTDYRVKYQVLLGKNMINAGSGACRPEACGSCFQGFLSFLVPHVTKRTGCKIQAALLNAAGQMVNSTELSLEIFPEKMEFNRNVCFLGEMEGRWTKLQNDFQWTGIPLEETGPGDTIVVAGGKAYTEQKEAILSRVLRGTALILMELEEGVYDIGGEEIRVKNCSMLPLHFASRDTGHELADGFEPDDIRYWYDEEAGYVTPLLERTFTSDSFHEIVTSGNQDEEGCWRKVMAVGERGYGRGKIAVCQLKLAGRTATNPTARKLAERLLSM